MKNDKYELLPNQTIEVQGHKLFRIRALRDFGSVKAGEEGGYVESEKNLRAKGNAWVFGDAQVFGDALVSGTARVYDNALVSGDARVSGDDEKVNTNT